jgi:hypothetical protein
MAHEAAVLDDEGTLYLLLHLTPTTNMEANERQ